MAWGSLVAVTFSSIQHFVTEERRSNDPAIANCEKEGSTGDTPSSHHLTRSYVPPECTYVSLSRAKIKIKLRCEPLVLRIMHLAATSNFHLAAEQLPVLTRR